MKKISLCSLMFFRTVFANDTVIDDSLIDGFYAGIGLQYTHYSNKIKATKGITVLGDSIQVNTDISHPQIDKFGGTVVAGYVKTFDKFYVGGEALLDINNDCKTDNTYACEGDSLSYSSNIKGIIPSIAVRFGYKCSITYCPILSSPQRLYQLKARIQRFKRRNKRKRSRISERRMRPNRVIFSAEIFD